MGSSAVILAAGGGAWAVTRDPKAAREPWQQAGQGYDDPMRTALSYAILAPNPHNRQPWLVDLKSDTEAVLYCQLDRRLPQTDPYNRQITVGLGCFLELLRIAALEQGYYPEITPFPEGSDELALDARPVAHIQLKVGARVVKDPLFQQILDRHTDRGAFDVSRPVSAEAISAISRAGNDGARVYLITDSDKIDELRTFSWDAWVTEVNAPAAHHESTSLTRIGKKEIEASPDGISISGPVMEGLKGLGILSREALNNKTSRVYAETLKYMKPGIETAMGYVVVLTNGNNRSGQIAAGSAYVRAHLLATEHGVNMHPLSQALQEFPEMAGPYKAIHEKLAQPGETVQMFARIGYGKGAPPSPRWPLKTRIMNG
jgi:hypothetical protein